LVRMYISCCTYVFLKVSQYVLYKYVAHIALIIYCDTKFWQNIDEWVKGKLLTNPYAGCDTHKIFAIKYMYVVGTYVLESKFW